MQAHFVCDPSSGQWSLMEGERVAIAPIPELPLRVTT